MTKNLSKISGGICILFLVSTVYAETYYVNNVKGNDNGNGLKAEPDKNNAPFKTIAKGVKALKEGDTLKLVSTDKPYYSNVTLITKKGSAGAPIVIDGQMATLCGARQLNADEWKQEGDLYVKDIELKKNILCRFFLVFNGKINRMGRALKGTLAPLKKHSELKPGEWTYDELNKKLYLRLLPGGKIKDIAEPILSLSSGVKVVNSCENIVIKNLIVEFFWNDGFNIHGDNKNIKFENIFARFNGDDGISAHETSDISVNNYVSIGNATGICHIQDSISRNENIYIKDSASIDLCTMNKANTFKNIMISSFSSHGLVVGGGTDNFENGFFQNKRNPQPKAVFKSSKAAFINFSLVNYKLILNTKESKGKIETDKSESASMKQMIEKLKKIFNSEFSK